MKRVLVYINLLLGFPAIVATAQSVEFIEGLKGLEKRADKSYYEFSYQSAASLYEELFKQDTTNKKVALKLGDSYRNLNMPKEASLWYGKVLKADSASAYGRYLLYYAESLMEMGEYNQAIKYFKLYQTSDEGNWISGRLGGLYNSENYFSDSAFYEINPISINTASYEFSPMIYKEGLVYLSNSNVRKIIQNNFKWDNTEYLDLFYTRIREGGEFDLPVSFSKSVNTKYHEGPATFYKNESKMVFTRNQYHKGKAVKSKDGITKLQLFFADNVNGSWSNITPYIHNSKEFSIGHPAIDEEGTILIFASDKEGGHGGSDLYYSTMMNGVWSEPINFGDKINTPGDELFPYLYRGTILYFSSNGHGGLGGLDIYSVVMGENELIEPVNVGAPLNSQRDDFGISRDSLGLTGFFSSNRNGNDDIFSFNVFPTRVHLKVFDAQTGATIDSYLLKAESSLGTKNELNGFGKAELVLQPGEGLHVRASSEGYVENSKIISGKLAAPGSVLEVEIGLQKKLQATADPLALIVNGKIYVGVGDKLKKTHIDDNGNLMVQNQATGVKLDQGDSPTQVNKKIADAGYLIDDPIIIENIHYDLDKFDIHLDYYDKLDHIVRVMSKYQNLRLSMNSYADSRGSDEYNLSLSEKRSQEAFDYLVKEGISESRIIPGFYGEYFPVNNCNNGIECDEEMHIMNRRTEFHFLID
ncbi:OmpA family protein [uncultured Imperialibacter sp.]|uniref:OmpA family protein n=1 Tax=uncultured Imperialibacter sp. TaxID=1672639 RepID=UPI0030D93F99|tara:strand:- start:145069 stop:147165 length:2097 start_codon:yes stop_codon:yes gene_type:complete